MNMKRGNFAITYDDNTKKKKNDIYVFGGHDGDRYLNHCERYSVEKDEWTVIAAMNHKKSEASACMFNN